MMKDNFIPLDKCKSELSCRDETLYDRGLAACIKCGKKHLILTDDDGKDFVCSFCNGKKLKKYIKDDTTV